MSGDTSPPLDYRLLFEAVPDPCLVLDRNLNIVEVNKAYLAATMTKRDEIVGHGIFEIFPDNPDDPTATGVRNLRASLNRVLKTCAADVMAVQKYDIRKPAAEGGGFEERYWSPINTPVCGPDHEITCIIHRVLDVTEFVQLKQKGAEEHKLTEDLRTLVVQMEAEIFTRSEEVAKASRNLKEANDKLETQNRELQETRLKLQEANLELEAFSYSVSHDLRGPLRNIYGFSQILVRKFGDMLPPQGQDYLARIRRGVETMERLITDILALSRVARTEVLRETIDLSAIAAEVITELKRTDPGRRVEVEIEDGLLTFGDRNLLRIVMDNLLGNAWKFTGRTGEARIEFRRHEGCHFVVRDNGAGFQPEYGHKLFVPFQRLHSEEEFAGSGIGLAIVKTIITRHGGEIRAEGEPGKGAAFFFCVPC